MAKPKGTKNKSKVALASARVCVYCDTPGRKMNKRLAYDPVCASHRAQENRAAARALGVPQWSSAQVEDSTKG